MPDAQSSVAKETALKKCLRCDLIGGRYFCEECHRNYLKNPFIPSGTPLVDLSATSKARRVWDETYGNRK